MELQVHAATLLPLMAHIIQLVPGCIGVGNLDDEAIRVGLDELEPLDAVLHVLD